MSRATQLAKHLERTVTGPMWHGPALANVLDSVSHEQAASYPINGGHSIWEIVRHVTTWAEIARERLKGESIDDPTAERDWPPVIATGPDEWRLAIEQLGDAHRMLAIDVRVLDDEALDATIPGLKYSVWILLQGVAEHGTYHAGQIALLKRALEGKQPART